MQETNKEYGPTVPFSQKIHQEKYRLEGESFYEAMCRIAGALAETEQHRQTLKDTLLSQRFLPAGRIQAAVGTAKQVTPFNCFVSNTIEDDSEAIFDSLKYSFLTMRKGGGLGYDFSRLRPRRTLIASLDSFASGPLSFMNIFDASCETVMSAGHRRGAQMGVLRIDHPDIELFIKYKQNQQKLTNFNISVGITDEFMECLRSDKPFPLKFNGKVYREVSAKYLWEELMRANWDWAEPGVLFIDAINKQNNLSYCETIEATNPCLVEGTLVQTPRGLIPVEDIKEGDSICTINNGVGEVETVESHENKEVFEIKTTDGSILKATAAHVFHVLPKDSKLIKKDIVLSDLKVGDKLLVSTGCLPNNWTGDNPFEISEGEWGLLIGTILGDGCYIESKNSPVSISSSEDDREWNNTIESLLNKCGTEVYWDRSKINKALKLTTRIDFKRRLSSAHLLPALSVNKKIPLEYINSNEEFLKGLVDGLISTDGNVNMNKTNPMLRLTTSSFDLATGLKRILSMFGVHARIYDHRKKGYVTLIDGREIINSCDSYNVVVLGEGLHKFCNIFTLSNPKKQERLDVLLKDYNLSGETHSTTIKSIEKCEGTYRVFDLYEPTSDTWITEGIVSRGCGEQPLPPNGACLLGSFNLVKYLEKIDTSKAVYISSGGSGDFVPVIDPNIRSNYTFNYQQFSDDIHNIVPMMDNIIDDAIYPLEAQKTEAITKRRMGLGITGLANTAEILGMPYASEKMLQFTQQIMRTLREDAYLASTVLAEKKGPFKLFDKEKYLESPFIKRLSPFVQERIRKIGIRNSHLISIAPTGTISISADNVSAGIEPPFALSYNRTVTDFDKQTDYLVEDYAAKFYGVKGRTSDEISAEEHVRVLTTVAPYVDSAVSKTCNIGDDVTWEEFKQVYVDAYEGGAKGCTTFRAAGKRYGVLNRVEEEPVEEGSACYIDLETGQRECS